MWMWNHPGTGASRALQNLLWGRKAFPQSSPHTRPYWLQGPVPTEVPTSPAGGRPCATRSGEGRRAEDCAAPAPSGFAHGWSHLTPPDLSGLVPPRSAPRKVLAPTVCCLMFDNRLLGVGGGALTGRFADFQGVKTPTLVDFKLLINVIDCRAGKRCAQASSRVLLPEAARILQVGAG